MIDIDASQNSMDCTIAAIQSAARRCCAQVVKNRARVYMRQPWQLDMIFPDLSRRTANDILRIVKTEQQSVYRFVGFGGEVRPINLRAAALVARYWRCQERGAMAAMAAE